MTEGARAIRIRKGHHDKIADLDAVDFGSDYLHASNRLMPHGPSGFDRFELLAWPKITATNAGCRDGDERIGLTCPAFFGPADL